jgi:hypothetical protein
MDLALAWIPAWDSLAPWFSPKGGVCGVVVSFATRVRTNRMRHAPGQGQVGDVTFALLLRNVAKVQIWRVQRIRRLPTHRYVVPPAFGWSLLYGCNPNDTCPTCLAPEDEGGESDGVLVDSKRCCLCHRHRHRFRCRPSARIGEGCHTCPCSRHSSAGLVGGKRSFKRDDGRISLYPTNFNRP